MPISRDVVIGPFNPFVVQPLSLTVKESGGADLSKKFTVKLAKAPRADVVIPITLNSTATTEITVVPTTLTFNSINWSVPQEVTVTAKEDTVTGDTKTVTVALGVATSSDIRFKNQDPADVKVTVQDKQAATP